ncbi:MAG: AAC(3) family N-acetyltransferase [Solirubrobacterales bacterium]
MRALLRRLPRPARERLRAARKGYRSARFRTRERLRPVRVDQTAIEEALRGLGIGAGDDVWMQTQMSAFGTIVGGPEAVVGALREVVGPGALVAMPAFPVAGLSIEYLRENPVFDYHRTPSQMGAITERFRRLPGSHRSLHPTHSIAALGPGAEELLAGHERAETPFGEGTPFLRLIERNARQVFFGTSTRPMTMFHAFECTRRPPFPYDVFLPGRFPVTCIDASGRRIETSTLVHRPRLSIGRIDANPPLAAEVRRRLRAARMACVPLGRSDVLAIPLQEMIAAFEPMLADGVTIYDPAMLEAEAGR